MNVTVCAHPFWPSLGGLELTAEAIASGYAQAGHDVAVVTQTPSPVEKNWPFTVYRSPGVLNHFRLFSRSDLVIARHLSIRCCWPMLLLERPFIIWHATWYRKDERGVSRLLRDRLMRRAVNVANSAAIGQALARCDAIIFPGYRSAVFRNEVPWSDRYRDFIYIGRLAREKGVDLLIDALAAWPEAALTVVGDGAERAALEAQAQRLGLAERVHFAGRKTPDECNALLNAHKVLIVPSRGNEPFGAVALEGQAAGCRVVVSSGGGLAEAAGPAGIIFDSGNVGALRDAMEAALTPLDDAGAAARDEHLRRASFEQSFVALDGLARAALESGR